MVLAGILLLLLYQRRAFVISFVWLPSRALMPLLELVCNRIANNKFWTALKKTAGTITALLAILVYEPS